MAGTGDFAFFTDGDRQFDVRQIADLIPYLTNAEERSILFSSHNTLDVEQLSDTITFIDRGRILHSDDKEIFLDRWRRVRLMMNPDLQLPSINGVVERQRDGRLTTLTTKEYSDDWLDQLDFADFKILEVQTMSLEEIFIANVQNARAEEAA